MHHSLRGSLEHPLIWSGSHRPLLLPLDSPCCLCLAENTMLKHSVASWALTHKESLIHYISNKTVKVVRHDEIHKITNNILCGLSAYLHMGIMKCKLVEVSHMEHQQNMLRKNVVPLGNEFLMFQTILLLSMSVLNKGTTFLQKIGNLSPNDTASYLRKHESSATLL